MGMESRYMGIEIPVGTGTPPRSADSLMNLNCHLEVMEVKGSCKIT